MKENANGNNANGRERDGSSAAFTNSQRRPFSAVHRLDGMVLDRAEVARILRQPEGTIDYLHRTSQLCGVVVSKRLVWLAKDVERFIESLEVVR